MWVFVSDRSFLLNTRFNDKKQWIGYVQTLEKSQDVIIQTWKRLEIMNKIGNANLVLENA